MSQRGVIPRCHLVRQRIVERLALQPVPIDPDLGCAHGTFRGAPVSLETNVWRGQGVAMARFAVLEGPELEIGNIMCVPETDYVVPILGADIVAVRGRPIMIAADLSPVSRDLDEHLHQYERLRSALADRPQLPDAGPLPEWAHELFSPYALYTRVDDTEFEPAFDTFGRLPDLFAEMIKDAEPSPSAADSVRAAQQHYQLVHREDDKGLRLLAGMFGADWAQRYLRDVLFPVESRIQ